jgi:hypothetical protein
MIVKGYSFKPTEPGGLHPLWRIYGTKRVVGGRGGEVKPLTGSWELVREIEIDVRPTRVTIPDFDLEFTREGGWRFYDLAVVTRDGREIRHAGEEFVFPREIVERCGGEVDVAELLLYDLERRGVIVPGQF